MQMVVTKEEGVRAAGAYDGVPLMVSPGWVFLGWVLVRVERITDDGSIDGID